VAKRLAGARASARAHDEAKRCRKNADSPQVGWVIGVGPSALDHSFRERLPEAYRLTST
jgi:hypothetical protein